MMELDTEIEDTSPVAEPCVTSPMGIWLWLLRLALCIAAGLALFLASLSFSQAGLPPGCGDGSGCADVLTSRWSTVLGLPVSLPAAVVYLAMLASTVWIPLGMGGTDWSFICSLLFRRMVHRCTIFCHQRCLYLLYGGSSDGFVQCRSGFLENAACPGS